MFRCCTCCKGDEDGIIQGPIRPLPRHLHTTITEYFQREIQAKRIQGKKSAIECGGNKISFLELDHYSSSLAGEIQKHMGSAFAVTNPDEEILIGVCLPTSEKIIALIFAILKLGAAFLPLDPHLPEDSLLLIIHKFRPVMVITDDDGPILGKYDAKSFAEFTKLMSIEEIWLDMVMPPENDPKWRDGSMNRKLVMFSTPLDIAPRHRPAIVVPTTGVTGNPRGVRIGHMTILHRMQWEWREIPFANDTISGITVPIMTLEGVVQALTALLKGATVHVFKKHDTSVMTNFIHKAFDNKITRVTFTTNNLLPFLQAAKGIGKGSEELKYFRVVSCMNDTLLPVDLVQDFLNFFAGSVTLVSYYGYAETCGLSFFNKLKSPADLKNKSEVHSVILDRVMDNSCLYVMSDYLELTKDGFQGEICIAGNSVALGYVDMKEEAEERRFIDNPVDDRENYKMLFRTGDFGRIEKLGKKRIIFLEGRTDGQVTIRGQPVILGEIEELLRRNEKIEEAYLAVYEPSTINQRIVGFVLPRSSYLQQALMPSEVRGTLSNQLPDYLLPDIKILEEIPVVGKFQRVSQFLLMRSYEEERESSYSSWGKLKVQPDNLPVAKILLEGIFKFCGIPVSVTSESLDSNFYEIGGTSLNTLSVLLYLHKNGCKISLQDFFKAKSLNELITRLKEVTNKKTVEANETENKFGFLSPQLSTLEPPEDYVVGLLPTDKKAASVEIMSSSYTEKGVLERYHLIEYKEYADHFTGLWEDLIDDEMSTMVLRGKKVLGCSFNQDFYTPTPETSKAKPIFDILEYLQELKGSVLQDLPHSKETVFEVSWVGTHPSLSAEENVKVVTLLMNENLKQASKSGFGGVFILVTNRLLRELCVDAFGFEVLDEYPARLFQEAEGFRPFRVAPSTVTTSVCWKVIGRISAPAPALLDTGKEAVVPVTDVTGKGDVTKDIKEEEKGKTKLKA